MDHMSSSQCLDSEDLLREVPLAVESHLRSFFVEVEDAVLRLAPQAGPLLEQVKNLTLRGGKRLRPAFVVAAHHCSAAANLTPPLVALCGAVELLQTYLLIHDDWMDDDQIRRNGPSVHVLLSRHFGTPRLGEIAGVLAGDLANALAQEMLARATLDVRRTGGVLEAFSHLQRRVFCGQFLDIVGTEDFDTLYDLKTGSYSVRGPLALGHALAEGNNAVWSVLERYARPIGIAFQMRDDLLDYHLDGRSLALSNASDRPTRRHTMLNAIILDRATQATWRQLLAVIGRDDAASRRAANEILSELRVVETMESRIAELRSEALIALESTPLPPTGKQMLAALAYVATDRSS
jgi:geranylgeranyl diphosphate synthase, type I